MHRRPPPARENPLTPTHGREPRSSVQAFLPPDARPNKTDAASATGDSVRWCVYGFWGRGPVPDSGPSPRRRRLADRLLAGDCHEPDLGPGGAEQPAAEGLAFKAPQPEGQRRDHLQAVQLHPVNDPQRAAPAQRLRTVDGPDVGPHGRLEDPEQPGYFRLREPHLSPGRAADRDPSPSIVINPVKTLSIAVGITGRWAGRSFRAGWSGRALWRSGASSSCRSVRASWRRSRSRRRWPACRWQRSALRNGM